MLRGRKIVSALRRGPLAGSASLLRPQIATQCNPRGRWSSTTTDLVERVREKAPEFQALAASVAKEHGDKKLCDVTVLQAMQGMRGIVGLVTETSLLDAEEGIEFRGYTIPQCQEMLPKVPGGEEPLPEGMLWLLLTGEVPNSDQVAALSADLRARSELPDNVKALIDSYPSLNMHPMAQLSSASLALQSQSKFAQAYRDGLHRSKYWEVVLDDALDLVAKVPEIAARIYRNTFHGGSYVDVASADADWAGRFAAQLGVSDDPMFSELMRMYLTIHTDHEGGNVSAHACHLVGSALADPYLSYSASMNGLAGPLHGLANQEVLRWVRQFQEQLGGAEPTRATLEAALWDTLNSGKVIPGYGHAVLRKTDPRYIVQREYALKHLGSDPLVHLVTELYDVVPGVLKKHGKAKNPWPNVDAHSGVLLSHYGLVEEDFYTVLFGVSRSMGVMSSLVIDRILGAPIERPKSITLQGIQDKFRATNTRHVESD